MSSVYMHWAKMEQEARFNLAASGVMDWQLADLNVEFETLKISIHGHYGWPPLVEAIAAHCGVSPDCVGTAAGTSMANHLAMAAILDPGDQVWIEHPAYEPLLAVARYLRADVKRFARRHENGFAVDPDAIPRGATLAVVTNLHNPSSVLADDATLRELGRRARWVLVDEAYLESGFERAPRPAFHLGENFMVTNSLTKVYGLSGLRCGWTLAPPALAKRMRRLNDLFGVNPPHIADQLSLIAFGKLPEIAARVKALLERNRALLFQFFDRRPDLEAVRAPFGTVAFPKLLGGSVERLCSLLREKYETTIVPGSFFEMPEHFRLGISRDTPEVAEGLARLETALDEVTS